jgi:hypothetical protein
MSDFNSFFQTSNSMSRTMQVHRDNSLTLPTACPFPEGSTFSWAPLNESRRGRRRGRDRSRSPRVSPPSARDGDTESQAQSRKTRRSRTRSRRAGARKEGAKKEADKKDDAKTFTHITFCKVTISCSLPPVLKLNVSMQNDMVVVNNKCITDAQRKMLQDAHDSHHPSSAATQLIQSWIAEWQDPSVRSQDALWSGKYIDAGFEYTGYRVTHSYVIWVS